MLRLNPDGQNILFAAVILTHFAGFIVLAVRGNVKGREYLRRLPPVDGVPLDRYVYHGWWWTNSPQHQAWLQRQSDPEVERLRQEGLRFARLIRVWLFGFPVLVAGVLALLILTGLVRFTP
jgi:hypothetical protein